MKEWNRWEELLVKEDWRALLAGEMAQDYFRELQEFLDGAYAAGEVYPPREQVYAALELTGYREARVVILGQDPYHGPGQAHGLSFSVAREDVKFPPSLRNMLKELEEDLGVARTSRNLTDWAEQGVLLLNTVLTVNAGQAASHRGKGWERFTDAVIARLSEREQPLVFVLWGADAAKKLPLIDRERHRIVASAHPSPLSARRGFFGSKPYSQVNRHLRELGMGEICWG